MSRTITIRGFQFIRTLPWWVSDRRFSAMAGQNQQACNGPYRPCWHGVINKLGNTQSRGQAGQPSAHP